MILETHWPHPVAVPKGKLRVRKLGWAGGIEKRGSSKITPQAVRAIRAQVAAGADRGALAQEYGLHRRTLNKIVSGTTWQEVDE